MILPVSAQRFCCRNRVREVVAHWGAKSAREKYKGSDGMANFGLLRDSSFFKCHRVVEQVRASRPLAASVVVTDIIVVVSRYINVILILVNKGV